MPTTQPIDSRLGSVLAFRRATAGDAAALAPLVLASGRQEFDWFLGVPPAECEAFLRHAIAAPSGRFSWKRHLVATLDGQPVAALAIQDGRKNRLDDLYAVRDFLQHFGPRRTPGIIRRGLILETEIPAPARRQTLLAHCATHPDLRGRGVFSALFAHAMTQLLLPAKADQMLVLDVLDTNRRAASLYCELGFEPMEGGRRSARLPTHLAATRMRYRAQS
jgi:GNAT superfamily N-acetyltransferase